MPAVRGHRPCEIVGLIHAVERMLKDLSDLGDTGAIKKTLVTKCIESKLPENLNKKSLRSVMLTKVCFGTREAV